MPSESKKGKFCREPLLLLNIITLNSKLILDQYFNLTLGEKKNMKEEWHRNVSNWQYEISK